VSDPARSARHTGSNIFTLIDPPGQSGYGDGVSDKSTSSKSCRSERRDPSVKGVTSCSTSNYSFESMNQTPDIVAGLLRDPAEELQRLMADPRTTEEAREAVASVMSPPPTRNGAGLSNGIKKPVNGRLQVVDEHQTFT
jgi:hypothetical protein